MRDGKMKKAAGDKRHRVAVMVATAVLVPTFAFAVETDRVTVEDPATGAVMFRVTSGGNVTGTSFNGDGSALANVPHWKGDWNSVTTYNKDQVVFYSGSSYIALKPSVGSQPNLDASAWAVLAQQGPEGVPGRDGASVTQADILNKLAEAASENVLAIQDQTAGSTATKFSIKDSTGVQKLIATADGRLGVGTDSLASKFDIVAQWQSIIPTNLMLTGTSYGDVSRFTFRRANGTTSTPTKIKTGDVLGALNFRGHDGASFSSAGIAGMQAIAAGDYSSVSQPTNLSFFTTPTGAVSQANRLQILANGNIGMGTTAPAQKLEVNGGVRLNTAAAKPVCDSTIRGTFWMTQNGSGVTDSLDVCIKNASDIYVWKTVW